MSRPPNKPLPIVTSKRKVKPADLLNFFLTCSEDVRRTYDLMPMLQPGAAHLLAALGGKRKAAGNCRVCQKRCDRNSVLYCPFHLAEAHERMRPKPTGLRERRDPRDKTVAADKMILLLNCSERFLRRFELARVNAANSLRNELQGVLYEQIDAPDLRSKMFATLDALVNQMAQLGLARWFRASDRESIKRAIEIEEDPALHAKKQIREQGRSETELMSEVFRSLDPGEAHRVAVMTYGQRNIAAGKCSICPKPLDRNSVRYCTKHLAAVRDRAREKSKRLKKGTHGKQPGTIKALKEANEKRKRGSK